MHAKLGESDDGGGRGAARAQHGRPANHRTQSTLHTVDVGVVGPPAALRTHQRVGRADEFRASGAFVGEPQRRELAGHRHRHTDPFRAETRYQARQFVGRALDAVIRPAVQPQRAVGGEVQLR